MFLTQEHPIAGISADGDLAIDIGSKDTVWQNVAVFREIENVLEDYPEYPYQVAFSINELRQKLVTHVLHHMPRIYSVTGDSKESKIDAKSPYRSKAERVRLDMLIRGSILHLLRENADWVGYHIYNQDNSGNNN